MAPTVGRIVHYHMAPSDGDVNDLSAANDDVLPAIIVRVYDEHRVNLRVFCDAGFDLYRTSVRDDEVAGDLPSWSWPPMVK